VKFHSTLFKSNCGKIKSLTHHFANQIVGNHRERAVSAVNQKVSKKTEGIK
jgi:hypothetical protein